MGPGRWHLDGTAARIWRGPMSDSIRRQNALTLSHARGRRFETRRAHVPPARSARSRRFADAGRGYVRRAVSSPEPPRPPTEPTERLAAPPPTPPLAPRVPPERVVESVPVEPRPERRWWDNPGPAILAGIVGLIVGGLLGYVIGEKQEPARRGIPAAAHTVTRTVTTVKPKVVVRTNTVTDKTVTQAPAPASEAQTRETETTLHRLEKENEELRRRQEEG
jgi:hypothetical protein